MPYRSECYSAECHFVECYSDECHFVECYSDECHYVECYSDECHSDESHSDECHSDDTVLFSRVALCMNEFYLLSFYSMSWHLKVNIPSPSPILQKPFWVYTRVVEG